MPAGRGGGAQGPELLLAIQTNRSSPWVVMYRKHSDEVRSSAAIDSNRLPCSLKFLPLTVEGALYSCLSSRSRR